VNVGLFIQASTNTASQAMQKGAAAAAKALGGVRVRSFSADFDPNKQVQQIQTAVATGQYNAIVIVPLDGTRVVPAIKQAAAKGVKVVCIFAVCGPDQSKFARELPEVSAQTGINNVKWGRLAAPVVNDACKDKHPCRVVIMRGLAQLASEGGYVDTLKAGLAPNVQVVATGQGQYLADASYKAMKDILQAHRTVDAVLSTGDQMAVGVEQAIDEAGLKGNVAIIGSGAGIPGVKAVKDGRWFATVLARPLNDGYVGTKYAIDAARGRRVPPLSDTQASPRVPSGVVTAATASNWRPEWAG
jgi:ribose transport system substrate-binding protein